MLIPLRSRMFCSESVNAQVVRQPQFFIISRAMLVRYNKKLIYKLFAIYALYNKEAYIVLDLRSTFYYRLMVVSGFNPH